MYNYKNWQFPRTTGVSLYEQNIAVSRVTEDACIKLKQDNRNARIYVVKFRKQNDIKSTTKDSEGNFIHSYGLIDSCASKFGADGYYSYDVEKNSLSGPKTDNIEKAATAEENLQKVLQVIADDIKEFAEYEEPKILYDSTVS